MAVSKMHKLTIIAEQKNSEQLLRGIQSFQGVQLRDVFTESANNAWVKKYFPETKPQTAQTESQHLTKMIERINASTQFIAHYGSTKEKGLHLNRQKLSLKELEQRVTPDELEAELQAVEALQEQFTTLNSQETELTEKEQLLIQWQQLDVLPTQQLKTSDWQLATCDVTAWETLCQALVASGSHVEEIYSDDKITNFSYLFLKAAASQVNEILQRFGAVTFVYPYPALPGAELKSVQQALKANHQAQKKLALLIGQKRIIVEKLEWAEEQLLAQRNRLQVADRYVKAGRVVTIQGWIAENELTAFKQTLAHYLELSDIYLEVSEPTKVEIAAEVPTKLNNHPLVKPFEMLTEMYSLPKYEEVDPTPWFMPFYLVFFGMMVADAGYGTLMLVATLLIDKLKILPRSTKRFVDFFKILAIPTIIWGILYDSYFGFALPYQPVLSTSKDVIAILILSIVFGLIQIFVGLGLAAREKIKAKNYLQAVSDGFAWQGILVGLVLALVGRLLLQQAALFSLGVIVAIISAVAIVIIPMVQSASKVKGLAKGAYSLYGITGYIGDLVSYTRLMALGISGGSIAAAFNMLVGFMPPVARFTVGIFLMLALHGLNIFLSLLSAYVHGARLQYVEFFGKFYEGGGKPFAPLKTEEKYLNIEERNTGGKHT